MNPIQQRAGPPISPTLSKVMPLSDTTDGYEPITVAEALVGRLDERGCHPKRFQWDEMTGWFAECPLDDPTSMASCGALTIRTGADGEALVSSHCAHTLAEVICILMGVYPDDPQLLGEAYRNSRKNPQHQGEVAR